MKPTRKRAHATLIFLTVATHVILACHALADSQQSITTIHCGNANVLPPAGIDIYIEKKSDIFIAQISFPTWFGFEHEDEFEVQMIESTEKVVTVVDKKTLGAHFKLQVLKDRPVPATTRGNGMSGPAFETAEKDPDTASRKTPLQCQLHY